MASPLVVVLLTGVDRNAAVDQGDVHVHHWLEQALERGHVHARLQAAATHEAGVCGNKGIAVGRSGGKLCLEVVQGREALCAQQLRVSVQQRGRFVGLARLALDSGKQLAELIHLTIGAVIPEAAADLAQVIPASRPADPRAPNNHVVFFIWVSPMLRRSLI